MFIVPVVRLSFHTAVLFCAAGTVGKDGGVGAEAAAPAGAPAFQDSLVERHLHFIFSV